MIEQHNGSDLINHLIERIETLETEINSLKTKPKTYHLSETEKKIKEVHDLMGGEMFIKVFIGTDKRIRIHDIERIEDHIQSIINQNFFDKNIREMTG